MCYYLKTLNKIIGQLVLDMLCLNGSYFFSLFQRNRIYQVRNIFDFFYAVSVVLLVFAPSQDQHHTDSFHRRYVKLSKRKSLLEHFLVARKWYVPKTPKMLLITQRDIQLGYKLNEACCRKRLQHLKNKYYIL